jgi:hypothetical protein
VGQLVRIRSAKGTHYTTALAQNVIDIENLGAVPARVLRVRRVTLWSVQSLAWDIALFRNNVGPQPTADLDTHALVDWFPFVAADGKQTGGAGPFVYSVTSVESHYASDDGNLYVGLVNRSAAAKNAGATGEVVIELAVEV